MHNAKTTIAKNKRILVLGANEESKVYVNTIQNNGDVAIVTDHIPTSPAKGIADEFWNINGLDVDSVVECALKNGIDAVVLGVADPLVSAYVEIAHKLNMPCFIKKEHIPFFTDKEIFISECEKEGIPVAERYYVGDSVADLTADALKFPCVFKPSKGRGGKGVKVCAKKEDISELFENAKSYSDNGKVIIEQYMNCSEVVVQYYFCNSEAHLVCVSDRTFLAGENAVYPVTVGNVYPSTLTFEFREKAHPAFVRLFNRLGIEDGVLEMQLFYSNGLFLPYDMAAFVSGEASGPILEKVYGINFVKSLVEYSTSGYMQKCVDYPNPYGVGGSIWILLNEGTISAVCGLECLNNNDNVIRFIQRLYMNDVVSGNMVYTEKSTFMRIWIWAETEEKYKLVEQNIRNSIRVYDENGKSMIVGK